MCVCILLHNLHTSALTTCIESTVEVVITLYEGLPWRSEGTFTYLKFLSPATDFSPASILYESIDWIEVIKLAFHILETTFYISLSIKPLGAWLCISFQYLLSTVRLIKNILYFIDWTITNSLINISAAFFTVENYDQ